MYHLFCGPLGFLCSLARRTDFFSPSRRPWSTQNGRGSHALFETAEHSEAVPDRFGAVLFGSVRTRTIGFVATSTVTHHMQHTRGGDSAKPHHEQPTGFSRQGQSLAKGRRPLPLPPPTTAANFKSTLPVAPASAARANPEQKGGDHRLRIEPAEVIPPEHDPTRGGTRQHTEWLWPRPQGVLCSRCME